MIAKHKPLMGSLCAILVLLFLSRVATHRQENEPVDNKATGDKTVERPAETKHIDLGDGLVLFERREFRDGKTVALIKTYERDGKMIMRHISLPGLSNDSRIFYRDGKEILSEEIDGNGHIILSVMSADDGSWYELFERQADNSIAPISTAKLKEARRQFDFMGKIFTPFLDAVMDGDKEKADQRLDSMIEKIKAGEFDPSEDDSASSK